MDMKRNIIFFALILICVFVAGCGSIAPIFSNASDWVFYSVGAKAVSYDGKGTFQFVEGYNFRILDIFKRSFSVAKSNE